MSPHAVDSIVSSTCIGIRPVFVNVRSASVVEKNVLMMRE